MPLREFRHLGGPFNFTTFPPVGHSSGHQPSNQQPRQASNVGRQEPTRPNRVCLQLESAAPGATQLPQPASASPAPLEPAALRSSTAPRSCIRAPVLFLRPGSACAEKQCPATSSRYLTRTEPIRATNPTSHHIWASATAIATNWEEGALLGDLQTSDNFHTTAIEATRENRE